MIFGANWFFRFVLLHRSNWESFDHFYHLENILPCRYLNISMRLTGSVRLGSIRVGSVCGLIMRNCERFFFGAQYLKYDCLVRIGIYTMNNAIKINLYCSALTLYVHGCRKIAQKMKYQIEINNLSIIWCESNGIRIGIWHFRCAVLLSSKKARMIYHFVINL